MEAIKVIQSDSVNPIKQDTIDPVGTYCGMRREGDEIINWNSSSRELFNFVRAICKPGPMAISVLNGLQIKINKVREIKGAKAYINKPGQDDYRDRTDYTLEEIVDKYHIGVKQHQKLKEYCDKRHIEFASTPFSKGEVDLLIELGVPFIKVASMDLDNIPFLKYIASKEKPVVISTGLCGLADVSDAVKCLKEEGCPKVILLHCVSLIWK